MCEWHPRNVLNLKIAEYCRKRDREARVFPYFMSIYKKFVQHPQAKPRRKEETNEGKGDNDQEWIKVQQAYI